MRPHFVIRYRHVQYAVQHADTSYLYSFWEHIILRVRVHKWNDYCTYYGIAATVRYVPYRRTKVQRNSYDSASASATVALLYILIR